MPADLNQLENLEGYRQYFMDAGLWRPLVQAVCQRHHLHPSQPIRPGLAGTYPTFIVEDRWVVKFFGRLFDGQRSYQVELQVGSLLPADLGIHVPAILATGNLFEDDPVWNWPYLIFEFIPGVSLGEVFPQVSLEDKLALARVLGKATRRMLCLPLERAPHLRGGAQSYVRFLREQRERCHSNHAAWGSFPESLLDQLEAYVLPAEVLVDGRFPCGLIHADLTRDHILGRLDAGRWVTSGLIDFGDALYGNILYDLPALHLDLFQCDKRLLEAYLEAYGFSPDAQFPRCAMSAALLHQFDVFVGLYETLPEAQLMARLDDLADLIWKI